ncbi:MAG: hypothetical protein H7A51_03930 [Akkermansiaceae bacterium]|nr:hypothetical protein [Akkermansiaceae bacterium]
MPKSSENQKKNDPHEIEGVKARRSKAASFPWLRVSFFVLVCGLLVIAQGPLPGKIWRKLKSLDKDQQEKTSDKNPGKPGGKPTAPAIPTPVPPKPESPVVKPPTDHTASSGGDIRKLSKGIKLTTKVTLVKGGAASDERKKDESYTAHYELKVRLPKAASTLPELEKNTPKLAGILPGLAEMVPKAQVSGFFYQLYENKTKRLKENATNLNELLTRHNFYDCETILNLKHPRTGRRLLLLQAEMDVVSDGSDGDRLPVMPDNIVNSSYYQPMTSYGWRKTGKTPNPLIAGWKNRIKLAETEIAHPDTNADRKSWLRARIVKIKREIQDMEARSYLIADYDPFIVMPVNILSSRGDKYAARIGDYAVVIYDGKIYPAIVGDAGPSFKVGEASLRMCKQLNARASSYSRPVSDLAVTYVVFPGTADKFQAPDYARWHTRCASLLTEVGGLGATSTLHSWANTLPVIEKEETDQP